MNEREQGAPDGARVDSADEPSVARDALRDDTPILEERIITSADVMELILVIEELRGSAIDVERLDPVALRSIDSICRSFFAAEVVADGR